MLNQVNALQIWAIQYFNKQVRFVGLLKVAQNIMIMVLAKLVLMVSIKMKNKPVRNAEIGILLAKDLLPILIFVNELAKNALTNINAMNA